MPRNHNGDGPFTRARLETLALLGITVLLLFLSYKVSEYFVPALSWALALSVVAWPLHVKISRHIKREGLAAAITVVAMAILLVLPVVLVAQQTTVEAKEAVASARSPETKAKWQDFKQRHPGIGRSVDWVRERFVGNKGESLPVSSAAGNQVAGVLTGTVHAIIQLFVALFALFFFLRDRAQTLGFLRKMLPISRDESDRVFRTVHHTVHATVFGHVLVAVIQGALGGLMFWLLGLPAPLLWGVVMALLSIVPVLGAFVIWVPAAIYLALSGELVKAAILTAWGSLAVGTIDNILYPVFVGSRLRLHTLPVFVSIVGGLAFFGTAGVVLGPLVLALLMAVFDIWKGRTRHGQSAEEKLQAA